MERLTQRDEFGNTDIVGVDSADLQLNLDFEEFNRVTNALNKLADYEDLEEQGLLVKLPCKVRDTVYVLVEMDDNGKYTRVKNDVVKSFYISPDNIPMVEFTYIWHDTQINDFGKSVFLTREQAEQALKEMEVN